MSESARILAPLAAACARRLPASASASTFDQDRARFARELDDLVAAVRGLGDRYAFDVDGRPGAIAAVRSALPALESELFDAVLDDLACELAARQEALYRVALAGTQGQEDERGRQEQDGSRT